MALRKIKVTIWTSPLNGRRIVMARYMKVINDYKFAGANSVFFVVLLTILPRISHQSTGNKCYIFYLEVFYR